MNKGDFIQASLRALSSYELRRAPILYLNNDEAYGITDDDNKLILLSDRATNSTRLNTIIHELLHADDYLRLGKTSEVDVRKRTSDLFRRVYGFRAGDK